MSKCDSQLVSVERASELLCKNIPALKRLPAGRATAHLDDVIDDYYDDHGDVIDNNFQFGNFASVRGHDHCDGGGFEDGNYVHERLVNLGKLALGLRLQLSQTGWPSAHCHIRTCKYLGG